MNIQYQYLDSRKNTTCSSISHGTCHNESVLSPSPQYLPSTQHGPQVDINPQTYFLPLHGLAHIVLSTPSSPPWHLPFPPQPPSSPPPNAIFLQVDETTWLGNFEHDQEETNEETEDSLPQQFVRHEYRYALLISYIYRFQVYLPNNLT